MNKITDEEILRRLRLVRDIRLQNNDIYKFTERENISDYTTLENLDSSTFIEVNGSKISWGKVIHSQDNWHYNHPEKVENQDQYDVEKIKGNFEVILGYIYYDKLLDINFTDDDIRQYEDMKLKKHIHYIIYSLTGQIEFNNTEIEDSIRENNKLKERLNYLTKIKSMNGDKE